MNANNPDISPPKLLKALRNHNLLPAIVFLPTRRRCDEAAAEVAADKAQPAGAVKQQAREELFRAAAAESPEIARHKHRKNLLRAGVASHHAGHIPAWKLLIERMMSRGLLEAIFATSTVAAGVDFPARTVVVTNADTRGGDGWRPLRASELQQMTGRAGRRGKDNVGFVVLAPGQFQNPRRIAELLKSPPDDLQSQFRATYTSLLNLLDAFGGFAQVREIAEKSFAFRETAQQIDRLEELRAQAARRTREKIAAGGFDLSLADVLGFERLTSARLRLQEGEPARRAETRRAWLAENVGPGRVVAQGRGGKRLFLVVSAHGEKISAMRDDGQGASFALDRVSRIYEKKYPLNEASVEQAFLDVYEGRNPPLEAPQPVRGAADSDQAVEIINSLIEQIPPAGLSEQEGRRAAQLLWDACGDAEYLLKSARDVEFLKSDIWLPFERRARVLDHFGYLDFAAERVTGPGKWLADVRVDRPLLVGEALRRGIFEGPGPPPAAGLMAALAADSDRNYGELRQSDELLDLLTEFEQVIYEVSGVEWRCGVEPAEEINFSAAAAAESWAAGLSWDDLVFRTKAEEGDLVRLLSRTGEALLQVANLRESNPAAAALAREAADLILREPVK